MAQPLREFTGFIIIVIIIITTITNNNNNGLYYSCRQTAAKHVDSLNTENHLRHTGHKHNKT